MTVDAHHERAHSEVPCEAWWWWGWAASLEAAVFVGFEVRGRRFDYWAGLACRDRPYLYIEELDGTGRRAGLEIKPPEMWADHQCDVPMRQWSLGNEAHGVWLDDPTVAMHRPYGDLAPCTFDIEWHATDDPQWLGDSAYRQSGEVDARIELLDGVVAVVGPAERVHIWGQPYTPADAAVPLGGDVLLAPYRRSDGRGVRQVFTRDGVRAHTVSPR